MLPVERYVGQRTEILRVGRKIVRYEQRVTLVTYVPIYK
jgi:hypothetical protein